MKLVHWIFSLCLFTASMDVILVVHLGGTLRLTQLLMILVCVACLAKMLQEGRILWPRGGTAIAIWIFGQFLMLPLAGNLALAVQFFVLLLFFVFGVFAVVQIYGRSQLIEDLMRVYMLSFVFIALVGLLQFALPLVGLPSFLVAQWIIHGRLARINAFNYEPSYFSTYIMIGWIMLVDLRFSNARIAQGRFWRAASYVLGVAAFLCTSKTGWAIMLVEAAARIAPSAWRAVRNGLRQLRFGQMRIPLPRTSHLLALVLSGSLLLGSAIALTSVIDPVVFLAGTGLAGTASHSYADRANNGARTFQAFLDHPWIGPSLGGVPVYLAAQQGVTISDADGVRKYWGSPVIAEVLASSGIFFFIPFLIFLYTATFGAMRFARRRWTDERARWLRALGRAMIFEWLMLLSDSNLLRTYLWYHFAMVLVVAYHLEYAPAPAAIASGSPSASPEPSPHFLPAGATG